MSTRALGISLAFAAAVVSGVSIYVNGRGVKHFHDATVYTAAKNLVAAVLLMVLVLSWSAFSRPAPESRTPLGRREWLGLLAVGVVGGSVPFILFFEGLARAEATQAAFIQKTLVVWVALLAVPLLRERFGVPHILAISLLVLGQAWLIGSAGTIAFGQGEAMILAATILWAIEVVIAKRLLSTVPSRTLGAARMAIGTGVLLAWVAVSGKFGTLMGLDAEQWRWVLLTGLLLTAYVALWYAALARAQAIDVTAVLVFGAVITALLAGTIDGASVSAGGTVLVAAGAVLIAALALRGRRAEAST